MQRREFLESSLAAGVAALLAPALVQAGSAPDLKMATFRFDVTPPVGHSLCGGWIKPVLTVDDPLESIGFILVGAGEPIVVTSVDWTGLLNEAHIQWRRALAAAAGTSPERVAVQCVHQHNAPFVCLDTEKRIARLEGLPHHVDMDFYQACLDRGAAAVRDALTRLQPVTHIAHGQAKVEKVASNRRHLNASGKVGTWRASSCKDPAIRALPEGLIDPWLKTVAFFSQDRKVASCHYYATHPMSYYGDGRVTPDFVGLARRKRQADEPECTHLYFTGCSGNVAAGKYNDGTPQARQELTDRIYAALVRSEEKLDRQPVRQLDWQTVPVQFPPNPTLDEAALLQSVENGGNSVTQRIIDAMRLGWLKRCQNGIPMILSALHVNDVTLLHLPAETFVEYQLNAQRLVPDRFVATAAYGDGGAWYIPTESAYPQGGYEVNVAFSAPAVEKIYLQGVQSVLARD